MRREYQGAAQSASLTTSLGGTLVDLTIYCDDLSNWPTGVSGRPFYVVIDRDTASEEKILCASRSGNVISVYNVGGNNGRGADGTSITAHGNNATIEHVFTATDADEANAMVNTLTTKGDLLTRSSSALVRVPVGTDGQTVYADSTQTPGVKWADPKPYAIAAVEGTYSDPTGVPSIVTATSISALTITFPVGRFTQPPVCAVTPVSTATPQSQFAAFSIAAVSTSSVSLNVINAGPPLSVSGGAALTEAKARVIAVQATSGSALG